MTTHVSPKALILNTIICMILFVAVYDAKAGGIPYSEEQICVEEEGQPTQDFGRQIQPQQQVALDRLQLPEEQGDWKFTLGTGIMYGPAFPGAKDYQMLAFPNFKVEYQDRFFASPSEGLGYKFINNERWSAGPIAKIGFGRKEDDDNPFRIAGDKTKALKGLGDVDTSLEIGAFVEHSMGPLTYQLELRQGLGGHKGFIVETGFSYSGVTVQFDRNIMYAVGPRVKFADACYNNAYFGIDERQSLSSGLAKYNADGGIISYGVGGFSAVTITDSVSLGIFGGYDRMVGEAADSPLIQERGDDNQFMFGINILYEFCY